MEIEIANKRYQRSQFWLISIEFSRDSEAPLFCLFLSDERDCPLTENKKLLFFKKDSFLGLLGSFGLNLTPNNLDNELDLIYNIENMIDIIKCKDINQGSTLLNYINILLDMINGIGVHVSTKYKSLIYEFADYLTFESNFVDYFESANTSEEDILNSLYWLNGVIFSNCKLM